MFSKGAGVRFPESDADGFVEAGPTIEYQSVTERLLIQIDPFVLAWALNDVVADFVAFGVVDLGVDVAVGTMMEWPATLVSFAIIDYAHPFEDQLSGFFGVAGFGVDLNGIEMYPHAGVSARIVSTPVAYNLEGPDGAFSCEDVRTVIGVGIC